MMILITTYISTSIGEAQSSASQLNTLIQQVLDSNLEISQRMANLEMRTLGYPQSCAPTLAALDTNKDDDSVNATRAATDAVKGAMAPDECVVIVEGSGEDKSERSKNIQDPAFNFTFDQDLNNSRPYARAMKRNSVWSTVSSTVHTMSWSYLSGLSLAEVSGISVIGLPVSPQELWNGYHYILTDSNLDPVSRKTETPVVCDQADVEGHGISRDEERPLETLKRTISYDTIRSKGGHPAFDNTRQTKKVPVTVDRRVLELKKIILLGIIPTYFY